MSSNYNYLICINYSDIISTDQESEVYTYPHALFCLFTFPSFVDVFFACLSSHFLLRSAFASSAHVLMLATLKSRLNS